MIQSLQKNLLCMLSAFLLLTACSGSHKIHVAGYIDARYTYLAAPVSGHLQKLSTYRGHQVTIGQLLAQLEQQPEASQLAQAKKELESAQQDLTDLIKGSRETILLGIIARKREGEANLLLAKQDLDRKQYLFEKNVIAKADYDNAVALYESRRQQVEQSKAEYNESIQGARTNRILAQQATVDSRQANVDRLQWFVSQKSFIAPVNAQVFDTYYQEGEYVPQGRAILALLAAEDIRVVFFLPQRYLSQIQLGTSLLFTCDGCGAPIKASINYISPQAEYTPPVIYSKDSRDKLVYRVEAIMPLDIARLFHPGQPVTVELKKVKHERT